MTGQPGPLGRALLQGAGLGVALALLALALFALLSVLAWRAPKPAALVTIVVVGLSGGLAFAPAILVELLAARRPPSARRDAVAAALSVLAAWLGLALLAPQLVYARNLGDPARGVAELHGLLDAAAREPRLPAQAAWLLLLLACPAGSCAVARLRDPPFILQVNITIFGAAALAVPLHGLGRLALGVSAPSDARFAVLLVALVLPFGRVVGELLELLARERLARWRAREA